MMETKFAVVQYQEGQHVMEDKYSWTPLLSRIFTEWFGQCVKSLPNRSYSGPYFFYLRVISFYLKRYDSNIQFLAKSLAKK